MCYKLHVEGMFDVSVLLHERKVEKEANVKEQRNEDKKKKKIYK